MIDRLSSIKTRREKRWVYLWAVVVWLFGIALLLVGGEIVMRWVRPDLVPSHQLENIPDPFIGWRFRSCQEVVGKTEHGERRHTCVNALGFPDTDHDLEKSPHTTRIVFLGDSFTAATHVDMDDSFVAVTRCTLQTSEPTRRFETLNFGQSGFGTANEYLTWKYYAASFQPDSVVLAFFLGNDVANNLLDYPTESFCSPKFEVMNGQVRSTPFHIGLSAEAKQRQNRNWFYRAFLAPSLLYQQYRLFARDIRNMFFLKRSRKVRAYDLKKHFWKRSYAPIDWQVYLHDPSPEFETAWQVTEALLVKLRDEVHAAHASFYVALLPGMEAIDPNGFRASFNRYPGIEQYHFDLDWPRQRLLSFLARQKIPTIDLVPVFQAELKKTSVFDLYFKFDRHFSVYGHRLAGEAIAHHWWGLERGHE